MASFKDYFQLMRPQATFVSVFIALVGMLLGGGAWLSWTTLLLIMYAFIFHWTGFANNEIEDLEYDKQADKNHKALVKGIIPFRSAMNLVILGQVFAVGIGSFIAGSNITAWFFMLFNIVNGILYNIYCKKTYANPVFIANCWMGLGLFGYFMQSSAITPVLILFAVNIWLMFFYDVAYLGYFKDPQDEKNLLKALGSQFTSFGWKFNIKTKIWAWGFKIANIGIGFATFYLLFSSEPDTQAWIILGLILASIALLFMTYLTTVLNPFARRRALALCALSEMSTYSIMMIGLGTIIGGPLQVFLIILLPIAWFIGINHAIWGKGYGLAPNV